MFYTTDGGGYALQLLRRARNMYYHFGRSSSASWLTNPVNKNGGASFDYKIDNKKNRENLGYSLWSLLEVLLP